MGGIYKSTSHLYFCFVIKKRIKKHHFTYSEELYYDVDLDQKITLGSYGYVIGSVIWDQELHRLKYWDGIMWQHLVTNNI